MIKKYLDFINESKESIESICKKYRIQNYTINDDGTVDVDGNVNMNGFNLSKLPFKFGKVTGYFRCSENKLTTLEGSPKEVGGWFDCISNKLTTMEGAPEVVGGILNCYDNQLISLKGSPREVLSFYCQRNNLESLVGGPKIIRGVFNCSLNKLKTLVGGPEVVLGRYWAIDNQLINFKGFPDSYEGDVNFTSNPVSQTLDRFPEKLWDEAIYWINEYDAIDDDGNVSEMLLEEVFRELGLQ